MNVVIKSQDEFSYPEALVLQSFPYGQWWVFQILDGENISDFDLDQIYHLEQDMWAHGIGEYISCNGCEKIFSKDDIFHTLDISLRNKTVSEIETILWGISTPICPCCWGITRHIFWEDYRNSIDERYSLHPSFLCVFRDTTGRIKWFMDGYISSFDEIYTREFGKYYQSLWAWVIKDRILEVLGETNNWNRFLCISSLWVHQENISISIIYMLMKIFFLTVLSYDSSLTAVYETALGTNLYAIYQICWGIPLNISISPKEKSNLTHELVQSDIFVHPFVSSKSLDALGEDFKTFARKNISQIKKILENSK